MAGTKGNSGGARTGAGRKKGDKVNGLHLEIDLTELRKLKRRLTMMSKSGLDWGFINGAVYTDADEPDRVGQTVASIAAKHEYGYPVLKIPPRPFFTQSIAYATTEIMVDAEKIFKVLIESNKPVKELKVLGVKLTSTVKQSITTGRFTALKPMTVARKGNDKMLEETGVMISSITYKLVYR